MSERTEVFVDTTDINLRVSGDGCLIEIWYQEYCVQDLSMVESHREAIGDGVCNELKVIVKFLNDTILKYTKTNLPLDGIAVLSHNSLQIFCKIKLLTTLTMRNHSIDTTEQLMCLSGMLQRDIRELHEYSYRFIQLYICSAKRGERKKFPNIKTSVFDNFKLNPTEENYNTLFNLLSKDDLAKISGVM